MTTRLSARRPPPLQPAPEISGSQAMLDALSFHIALVDAEGVILAVNEPWRKFAAANGLQDPAWGVGQNYLDICGRATAAGAAEARATCAGIRRVLRGEVPQFEIEYPCHSQDRVSWFRIAATPTAGIHATPAGAVITHHDITGQKLAEAERQDLVHELGERVKELRTLHEVTRVLADESASLETLFTGVAAALRSGMQHAERAAVCIRCGPATITTPGYADSPTHLRACFATAPAVSGGPVLEGCVEVVYLPPEPAAPTAEDRAAADKSCRSSAPAPSAPPAPSLVFLREEDRLVHTIAGLLRACLERRAVAESLRLSEARMAAAQRIGHFGSWELSWENRDDHAANTLAWSDETFRIAGFEPGAVRVTKEFFFSLVPAEDQPLITAAMTKALAAGESGKYEVVHRLVRPDGTVRTVQETAQLFCESATGRPLKMIGTVHDITDQRRAEQALLASEHEQRALVRQLQQERARLVAAQRVGKVGCWETDLATFLVTWSAETHHIYETEADVFHPTPEAVIALIHPDDREDVRRSFFGTLHEPHPHTLEHRLLLPGGRVKHIEQRWQNFFDDRGRPVRAIGTCQDITERCLASHELARTAALVRAVVDGTPDAVFVKDLQGRYQFFNEGAARLVGRAVEEVIGHDDTAIFPPADAAFLMERDREAMAAGRPVTKEEVLTAHGVTRTYLSIKAPYHDVAGNVIGLIGISRDITERKAEERRLSVLSTLGRQLNAATTARHAAEIIVAAADGLFGWDAATFDLYSDATGLITSILNLDTIAGARIECAPAYDLEPPSPLARDIILHGPRLILRQGSPESGSASCTSSSPEAADQERARRDAEASAGPERFFPPVSPDFASIPPGRKFGDTARPSASLMFVPIRDGAQVAGILSIQSYRPNAYTPEALKILELLADYCDGALSRIQTESLRKVSEARFREMAENIGDVFYSYDPAASRLLYANHALERVWGRPLCYFQDNLVAALDDIHPQDRPAVKAALRSQLQGRSTETEFRIHRPDGTLGWIRQVAVPILDPADPARVQRIVGTMRDVTERRITADRLAEQAALLDKAHDAILVRDLEHHILYWNKSAERLYGWTAKEALGRTTIDLLYHGRDPSAFKAATAATLALGEWNGELEKVSKDGRPITIQCHWSLVRDERGAPKSILTIDTDVTERKLIEGQYLRAQRMESIGTLAGGIAHDLNNVLAPILMSIDLLRMQEADSRRLSVLETIEQSAKRGADMVRQVLSFARGVEGRHLDVQPAHLLRDLEKIANETFLKNIQVRVSSPADLWIIEGDPTQLHQVLLNLCVNARDAMPAGGTLTLAAANVMLDDQYAGMHIEASPGPHVRITVEDTGTGMPPEVIDRIFEPFFTTKELGKGTGLGLSTTMAIVKSHSGFVQVRSEPGQGTAFHVYLPARPADRAYPGQDDTTAAQACDLPRGSGQLILLVDDEESVRQITSQTLEAFGYRVLTATDGGDAIALYAQHRHDISVVLTDMMMPLLDGPATIQVLRRMNPAVRIIAATGLNANGTAAKAAQAGVPHLLSKPYTAETLLKTLQQVLSVSEALG